jgi:hypothetical protein
MWNSIEWRLVDGSMNGGRQNQVPCHLVVAFYRQVPLALVVGVSEILRARKLRVCKANINYEGTNVKKALTCCKETVPLSV